MVYDYLDALNTIDDDGAITRKYYAVLTMSENYSDAGTVDEEVVMKRFTYLKIIRSNT